MAQLPLSKQDERAKLSSSEMIGQLYEDKLKIKSAYIFNLDSDLKIKKIMDVVSTLEKSPYIYTVGFTNPISGKKREFHYFLCKSGVAEYDAIEIGAKPSSIEDVQMGTKRHIKFNGIISYDSLPKKQALFDAAYSKVIEIESKE